MSKDRTQCIILVERHVIKSADSLYAATDVAAFASKNLYNLANYIVRQAFIHKGEWIRWQALFHLLKTDEAYCTLPRKVSNFILQQVDRNWKAFFGCNSPVAGYARIKLERLYLIAILLVTV